MNFAGEGLSDAKHAYMNLAGEGLDDATCKQTTMSLRSMCDAKKHLSMTPDGG